MDPNLRYTPASPPPPFNSIVAKDKGQTVGFGRTPFLNSLRPVARFCTESAFRISEQERGQEIDFA